MQERDLRTSHRTGTSPDRSGSEGDLPRASVVEKLPGVGLLRLLSAVEAAAREVQASRLRRGSRAPRDARRHGERLRLHRAQRRHHGPSPRFGRDGPEFPTRVIRFSWRAWRFDIDFGFLCALCVLCGSFLAVHPPPAAARRPGA